MRNTTAVLFLCLSIVVAFGNLLVNNYQYVVFCLPFFLACVVPGRLGKVIETAALALIGVYVLVVQAEYTGMVILFASTIWFFVYIHRDKRAKIYISVLSVFVGIASYFCIHEETKNIVIHATMDAAFYGIGSLAILATVNNLEHTIRLENKPIGAKYFALLDSLSATLHEVLETIKQTQEGAGHDRSRKDC